MAPVNLMFFEKLPHCSDISGDHELSRKSMISMKNVHFPYSRWKTRSSCDISEFPCSRCKTAISCAPEPLSMASGGLFSNPFATIEPAADGVEGCDAMVM